MKKVTKITENTSDFTERPKLRVAAYCRVSTDSDDQLVSLDTQIKHYESYIKSNPDWDFAGLYYDEGITGTKKEKRPELLRMISDCENKKIDFIVTKSINVGRDELKKRITDMGDFLRKQPTAITEYDEPLVRRLIEKVTVYEDKFTVEFKSGVTVDVDE